MSLRTLPRRTSALKRRRLIATTCIAAFIVVAVMISVVSFALAAGPSFFDVYPTNPYYGAITDLAGRGIITGFQNGNFGPNDPVTRQQFAKMIVLTGGYPVSEVDVCPFTDVAVSGPGSLFPDNYVAVCAERGIAVGKTSTKFDPYANITRYQVLSMVVRAALDLRPSLLAIPPAGWESSAGWDLDATHGANAARAEYNGLLVGLNLAALDPKGNMTRGEVAQVLHNLLIALTPPTTTTTAASTTTTTIVTTTTSSTTTSSTTTTTEPAGYQNLFGSITSGPAVAAWGSGRIDIFARGTSGQLMHKVYDGDLYGAWNDLRGSLAADSSPAAIGGVFHSLDVLVRGADNALWHKYTTGGGGWSRWELVDDSMAITSGPAIASTSTGHLEVFARGTGGALFSKTCLNGSWGAWSSLGGSVKLGSDPAAISWGPQRLDVFVRGTDDALYHRAFTGLWWSEWEKLGGKLTSSPAVTSPAPGKLEVFARGVNNTIWQISYDYYAGGWSTWKDLGRAAVASAPAAIASWGEGRIDLFVRGTTGAVWHKWWNGTKWLP